MMTPVAIYKATNILNGKMYIGQTVNPKRRFAEHVSRDYEKSNRRSRIGRAIKKHGKENFEFNILCWCPDKAYADMVETKLIEAHDTRGVGYNICVGGEGTGSGIDHPKFGLKDSEEVRRKKSLAHQGNKNYNYGKKMSAEAVAKMSASRKGRIITSEWRQKIGDANRGKCNISAEQRVHIVQLATAKTSHAIVAICGEETRKFTSKKAAARFFNVADVTIARWLKRGSNRDGLVFMLVKTDGD